jgi:AraC-like DNA-binding protein/mannose-6-phosphate isomerase-like protein (cupin superfamily)
VDKKNYTHELIYPSENLDVYIRLFDDSQNYVASHWHNSIEIIYLTSGELKVEIGQNKYDLKEGDCILINSGAIHSTHCMSKNTSILLQIPSTLLNRYVPDYKNYYFDLNYNSNDENQKKNIVNLKKILKSMESLKINSSEFSHLLFTSLVFELLYELCENFKIIIGGNQKEKTMIFLSQLEPVLDYTKLNYNRAISIQEISDIAHLQPEYFCRKFKKYIGQTFLEYLNEVRLAHIYHDLIHTNNHLNTILDSHVFTNYKLFYKTFKNKFGCTPIQLRKNSYINDK